jgi:hypothetical protein
VNINYKALSDEILLGTCGEDGRTAETPAVEVEVQAYGLAQKHFEIFFAT